MNIQAYDLSTRGRYFWHTRTVEGFEKAIGYFEQALRLDANYAPAYAGISDAYVLLGEYGGLPARELMPRAAAVSSPLRPA